jgi:hypothetical protein
MKVFSTTTGLGSNLGGTEANTSVIKYQNKISAAKLRQVTIV